MRSTAPLTNEPVARALVRLALPVLASQLLRLAYQWVDALWVRSLGVDATAAVTTSVFVLWGVYAINDAFAVGASAYVSQLVGAGDRRRAGTAAWAALRGTVAAGLVVSLVSPWLAPALCEPLWPEGGPGGGAYLAVVLLGAPLPMIALTCQSVMRAAGDTRTPLLIDVGAVALNALLTPAFVYGAGPVPALGVVGAAWATLLAQSCAVGAYAVLALRRHRALPLARGADVPVRTAQIATVGAPASLIGLLFSVVYVAFAHSAAAFGPAAVAIVGVANRIEALQFSTSAAIGTASGALVGQSLGAGRPDRALEVLRTGRRWVLAFTAPLTVLMLATPETFLALLSDDAAVLREGTPYLRVLALALMLGGAETVTAEAVLGSGHTATLSRIFTLVSLARIPLVMVIPEWSGLGVTAIAWVITGTCAVRTVAILVWAARGTWLGGLADLRRGAAPVPIASPAD